MNSRKLMCLERASERLKCSVTAGQPRARPCSLILGAGIWGSGVLITGVVLIRWGGSLPVSPAPPALTAVGRFGSSGGRGQV